MNLAHLEYFEAAAKDGSFSRAAKRLFVAPQTISTAVAALERAWGFALFDRRASSIELTEAGAAMLEHVAAVLGDLEHMEACARRLRDTAERVVTFSYASASIPDEGNGLSLADLERYRVAHKDTTLNVFELTGDACIDAVISHRADMAFVAADSVPDQLESACVSRGSFLVAVSGKNPLARLDEISFADLRAVPIFAPPDLNLTFSYTTKRCRAYGFEPRFASMPFSVDNARSFIRENRGVSFTPRFFAEDDRYREGLDAVFLPLAAHDEFSLPLRLVWPKGVAEGSASAELRDYILERFGAA